MLAQAFHFGLPLSSVPLYPRPVRMQTPSCNENQADRPHTWVYLDITLPYSNGGCESAEHVYFQTYRDQPAGNILVEHYLAPHQYIKAAEPEGLFLLEESKFVRIALEVMDSILTMARSMSFSADLHYLSLSGAAHNIKIIHFPINCKHDSLTI